MSFVPSVKTMIEGLPKPVGAVIAAVPYSWRPGIGADYAAARRSITSFDAMSIQTRREEVFGQVRRIVAHAYQQVPFYQTYYDRHGFNPATLRGFEDIGRIPIVTKADLNGVALKDRSSAQPGAYRVNTGGTSGAPLEFHVTPRQIPIEWAHMHHIWAKLGYRQNMLKVGFGGRPTKGNSVRYDALRHQYTIDVYRHPGQVAGELKTLLKRNSVRYLHGYPSALYEFALYCRDYDDILGSQLRQMVAGIFLGSEFPVRLYRDTIEAVFQAPTISWYGHTERAILAWEKEAPYSYFPFQTYGYCEIVRESGARGRLVGTSYWNDASPLIRYDTGDIADVEREEDGLLVSFAVSEGRVGEFVEDKNRRRIPLTALIFGRHHRVFEVAKFVQIHQSEPGHATILVTPIRPGALHNADWVHLFDSTGVDIEFAFQVLEQPVLTHAGKVALKVAAYPR